MTAPLPRDPGCIFCKIAAGELPARKIHEDDELIAFYDIAPKAPIHFMLVPKEHIPSTAQFGPRHAALMGRIMLLAPKLAQEQGCAPYPEGGWRIIINTGRHGGQEVPHLHVHVLGGPRPWKWGFGPEL
ncbi:MAG: histidine triad nucleotide-binding protein [Burkholderiaceae bacterium]|jgi:histidine triad (HIT) family protein|nr:histidine triad nucleotide-binding protein [Burkholderiaceae bacterium]